MDLHVFFAHRATGEQQAKAGFGTSFEWDIDLLSGYSHSFLDNVSKNPGTSHFGGCDTPGIFDELRQGRFDAVLSMGWHLKSLIQGIRAAKRIGSKVMVRGDSQLSTPRGKLKTAAKAVTYPLLLRTFDAALYVGERNRAYYQHYGYPDHRLFRSPHCIDTEFFSVRATRDARQRLRNELKIPHDTKLVAFAGKLVDFKRPTDFVEAVSVLRSLGVSSEALIIGSGPLESPVRTLASRKGVPLHMLGFRNQTEMPEAYAAADAVVLPSTARETWGLVCNEALACGTPIVVSNMVGCAQDLATDGSVGSTFTMGDTLNCAERLRSLFENPPQTRDIRQVSERFSLSIAADGVEEAMTHICKNKSH